MSNQYKEIGRNITGACTIISICPFPIDETKPGVHPNKYQIEAADLARHGIKTLIVKQGSFPVYMDSERGSFIVPEQAATIAKAVVEDYCSSQIAADSTARPALFYVLGEYDEHEAKSEFATEILEAIKKQAEWFRRLVVMADDDWAKTKQHKFITDVQRYAGRALGLQREWLVEASAIKQISCPGCAEMINSKALKCPKCQIVVDPDAYNKHMARVNEAVKV